MKDYFEMKKYCNMFIIFGGITIILYPNNHIYHKFIGLLLMFYGLYKIAVFDIEYQKRMERYNKIKKRNERND